MTSTTEPLDLETCFGGGRLATFAVTRVCVLSSVATNDRLVVDLDAKAAHDVHLAVSVGGKVEVGKLAASGDRVWLHERQLPIGGNVRVLGVVVGLVRVYERR